jgi:hypothetical protein
MKSAIIYPYYHIIYTKRHIHFWSIVGTTELKKKISIIHASVIESMLHVIPIPSPVHFILPLLVFADGQDVSPLNDTHHRVVNLIFHENENSEDGSGDGASPARQSHVNGILLTL